MLKLSILKVVKMFRSPDKFTTDPKVIKNGHFDDFLDDFSSSLVHVTFWSKHL